jgi:3-oxoacyl-[acyl-carrier protein] reductase
MTAFSPEHTVLVTGASSGIGAATAVAFARQGAKVALHYNQGTDRCGKVASEIEQAGGSARIFRGDLSRSGDCRRLIADVLEQCGRIDTLVNNAGALGERRTFLEITDTFLQHVLDTNLKSAFVVSQAVAPHMIERGAGSIINVSSIAGRNGGSRGVIAYATSKGGLTAMTKGIARELISHGIRVNAVNPGIIDTPLHERSTSPEQMEQLVSQIPQRRQGTSEEVAEVIVFLASSAASHIVGESIEINGGLMML